VPEGTLGHRLRRRRWSLGLKQKDAARQVGVPLATYRNWEVGQSLPALCYVPATISFLGYDWRPNPVSFGEAVRRTRTALGMSVEDLADLLHLDDGTIGDLEVSRRTPTKRTKRVVERWLASRCAR